MSCRIWQRPSGRRDFASAAPQGESVLRSRPRRLLAPPSRAGPGSENRHRRSDAARLLSHPPGRRACGVARPANICVAAENLCDSVVRRTAPPGAAVLRYAIGACPFRQVLHPLFSPRALAPFAGDLRARAAKLVDKIADRRQCDAVDVADTYASQALFMVCGLPPDDARAAQMASAAVIGDTTGQAQLELVRWLNTSFDAGLSDPERPPGILWPLLEQLAGDKDFPLTKVEVASVILLLFSVAGIEMVASAITFALLHLARDPQLRAQLREDPAQIPAFAEEIFRLEPPGPAIPRVTTRKVEIGGVAIPAFSSVWLALEAAGRTNGGDEITRGSHGEVRRQRHWAFGGGMHRCLGMHLARLEMDAFLTEWLNRIPNFELKPGFTPTVVHKPTSVTHLRRLKLRW